MPEQIPASVQIAVDISDPKNAKKNLEALARVLGSVIPASTRRAQRGFSLLKFSVIGFGIQEVKRNLLTLTSALRRTVAYGVLNVVRGITQGIRNMAKESADTSLMMGRTAAILTQNTGNTSKAYDQLVATITNTRQTTFMYAKDLARVNFTMAIAGVRGNDLQKAMSTLDKMVAITGEDANKLSMDFIRMANAFQISGDQFEQLGDVLVKGISNAVMAMPDLLNAVKMLGPVWVMAFGPGIDSAKEFTAAVAALSQVGLKGGQGARYLNRFILGLLAPTQETAALMRHMGINVYEAAGASHTLGSAMDNLAKRTGGLRAQVDRLVQEQAKLVAEGKNTLSIDRQIGKIQEELDAQMKALGTTYERFVHAGGKLRPVHEILEEFGSAMSSNNDKALEMFGLFKRIFQMRGMRAITLVKDIAQYREVRQEMLKYEGALKRISSKVEESWGAAVKKTSTAASKLKTLIAEMFGAPVFLGITQGLKEGIIDPLTDLFLKGDHWREIRSNLKTMIGNIFRDAFTGIGEFLGLLLDPKAFTQGKLERGTPEYEKALRQALHKALNGIKPMLGLIVEAFVRVGRVAGSGFAAAFGKEFRSVVDVIESVAIRVENVFIGVQKVIHAAKFVAAAKKIAPFRTGELLRQTAMAKASPYGAASVEVGWREPVQKMLDAIEEMGPPPEYRDKIDKAAEAESNLKESSDNLTGSFDNLNEAVNNFVNGLADATGETVEAVEGKKKEQVTEGKRRAAHPGLLEAIIGGQARTERLFPKEAMKDRYFTVGKEIFSDIEAAKARAKETGQEVVAHLVSGMMMKGFEEAEKVKSAVTPREEPTGAQAQEEALAAEIAAIEKEHAEYMASALSRFAEITRGRTQELEAKMNQIINDHKKELNSDKMTDTTRGLD